MLLQGVLGIVLFSFVLGAVITDDVLILGIGAWSWFMLAAYFGSIWIAGSQGVHSWVPAGAPRRAMRQNEHARAPRRSLRLLIANTAAAGGAILVAGLVDALHPGPPVLVEAGRFAAVGALLAIVLTAIYLAGMIERRDRTVARMGIDSFAALACYAAGVVVLYQLKMMDRETLLFAAIGFAAVRASTFQSSVLERDDAPPQTLGAPDAAPQRLQLDDLSVVDEKIQLGPVVLDVPGEDLRVRGFEHDFLQPKSMNDPGHHVGAPRPDVFGDAFGFDHDQVCAGVDKTRACPMIQSASRVPSASSSSARVAPPAPN